MTKVNRFKGFRNQKQQVKTGSGRKMSSTKWLHRHLNDPYVALAKEQGYRSRAAFKLKDIFEKYTDFKKAKVIVDLGCAPGGWLQVLKEVCSKSVIVGLDLKEVDAIEGVDLIVGDFLEEDIYKQLEQLIGDQKVELLLSDMASNASGDKEIDHFRNVELIEMALEFANNHLAIGGNFVAKFLRGKEEEQLRNKLKQSFKTLKLFKPKTSYADSSEVFLIALQFKDHTAKDETENS
ncbi:MAG: RlmE family RNA methyltransferase [Candidatus Jidaibacter sp.]|jgi:23S rRNA (uridine2552-2'-O)-methyltransferase|nr:RlmE family RNA methyltransferase [Candidatus Jidaibacter sp.]